MLRTLFLTTALLFSSSASWAKDVSPTQFWQLQQEQPGVLLDVRTLDEYQQGHLSGAKNIPFDQIARLTMLVRDKDTPLYLYCRSGRRASVAEQTLTELGYTQIYNGRSYQVLQQTSPN